MSSSPRHSRGTASPGPTGCNGYNGPAEITGTTISLGPFAGTLKACPDPIGPQATQYLTALGLARTYEVKGNQLTLFREGGHDRRHLRAPLSLPRRTGTTAAQPRPA